MKKYIVMAMAALTLASCMDTIILPNDITVGEDFWQRKSDVQLMVNGAYQGMTTENVIERLIVWGSVRSDEMVQSGKPEGAVPNALAELISASTQLTNRYATWSDFYTVINRCNIVLQKAGDVLEADPNYTEGDYLTDCSQMLALRSLCYFYLVRNFRDVPYTDVAFMNSSQDRNFVQMAPYDVLQKCIESLEEAAANAIQARSYASNDWRRVGWFTQDGIYALLADVYLWRASVMHSDADYQKAVEYCNLVIESKKSQHVQRRNAVAEDSYPLAEGSQAYASIFGNQNAEESIFELQLQANPALCKYFYKYSNNNSSEGFLKASSVFTKNDAITKASSAIDDKVFPTNDIRYYTSIFTPAEGAESFEVRKMISNSTSSTYSLTTQSRGLVDRTYADIDQNYIIYRLSDVMLMKAEALVQLVDTTMSGLSDEAVAEKRLAINEQLREAFNLVQAVNTRSLLDENKADSLTWTGLPNSRTGKTGLELLVLEERLRELCFEGKRWYDLLRFNYRHVTGVNYNDIMGNIGLEGLPANYKDMLDIATRGKGTISAGLTAKLRNEAYLYLPIPNSDQILAPEMKQNPAYGSTNQFQRN